MAFISPSPLSPTKGIAQMVTLNRSALQTELATAYPSDDYFVDANLYTNWKAVVIVLRSSIGNQQKTLIFDGQSDSTADLLLTGSARDAWNVVSTTIYDFDGGHIKLLTRDGQLTIGDFDFDLSLPPIVPTFFSTALGDGYDYSIVSQPYVYESFTNTVANSGTSTHEFSPVSGNDAVYDLNIALDGNGYVAQESVAPLQPSDLTTSLDVTVDWMNGHLGNAVKYEVRFYGSISSWAKPFPAFGTDLAGAGTIASFPKSEIENNVGTVNRMTITCQVASGTPTVLMQGIKIIRN